MSAVTVDNPLRCAMRYASVALGPDTATLPTKGAFGAREGLCAVILCRGATSRGAIPWRRARPELVSVDSLSCVLWRHGVEVVHPCLFLLTHQQK
jgi:hypothetical protein